MSSGALLLAPWFGRILKASKVSIKTQVTKKLEVRWDLPKAVMIVPS